MITTFLEGLEKKKSGVAPSYLAQGPIIVMTIRNPGACYGLLTKPKLPIHNNRPMTLLTSSNHSRKIHLRLTSHFPNFIGMHVIHRTEFSFGTLVAKEPRKCGVENRAESAS